MPATSQAQQRLFGMVLAHKRKQLKKPTDRIKEISKYMSMKDIKDFANTLHEGLPEHVKEAVARGFQKRAEMYKHANPQSAPLPSQMLSGAAAGGLGGATGGALVGPAALTLLAGLALPGAVLGGGIGGLYGAYRESGKPEKERNYIRGMLGKGAIGAGLGVGLPILGGAALGAYGGGLLGNKVDEAARNSNVR